MRETTDKRFDGWLHVAVAAVYAGLYALAHTVSWSLFVLPSGFRVALLLLLPYRFWPALAVGELIPLAWLGYQSAGAYGWLWGLAMAVPKIPLAMPVAWWCRRRLRPFRDGGVDMTAVLVCGLGASGAWTLGNLITYAASTVRSSNGSMWIFTCRWILGNYIGVLVVTPVLLMLVAAANVTPVRRWWAALAQSRLALDTVQVLLPGTLLVSLLASGGSPDMRALLQAALFVPVVWMTFREGWRGAAVAGSIAGIAVLLPMPALYDPGTTDAQVFVAFATSTMLLWGGRVSALAGQGQRRQGEAREALALAQRTTLAGEVQLRRASLALLQLRRYFQPPLLPGAHGAAADAGLLDHARSAERVLYGLADYLYPQAWGESGVPNGLRTALREGAVPRALDEAGVHYWCEFDRCVPERFSPQTTVLLYRLTMDGIAALCGDRQADDLRIKVRGWRTPAGRKVLLRLEVRAERLAREVDWSLLVSRLPLDHADALDAIRDRVVSFQGVMRLRDTREGRRLSVLLPEPDAVS